jgi:hypothetical protein
VQIVHERPIFDNVLVIIFDRSPLGDQRCSFTHTEQTITIIVERNLKSRISRAARVRVVAESRRGKPRATFVIRWHVRSPLSARTGSAL